MPPTWLAVRPLIWPVVSATSWVDDSDATCWSESAPIWPALNPLAWVVVMAATWAGDR